MLTFFTFWYLADLPPLNEKNRKSTVRIREALATYVVLGLTPHEIKKVTETLFDLGHQSPSLFTAMGLTLDKDPNEEFQRYFGHALSELKLELPDREEALHLMIKWKMDSTINDTEIDFNAIGEVFRLLCSAFNVELDNLDQHLDSLELEKIFLLWGKWWDLKERISYEVMNKQNELGLERAKVEIEMLKAIKAWKISHSNHHF